MVEKGVRSGGSQGGGRSHRELDIVGRRIGLTCEEAGGALCKNILKKRTEKAFFTDFVGFCDSFRNFSALFLFARL